MGDLDLNWKLDLKFELKFGFEIEFELEGFFEVVFIKKCLGSPSYLIVVSGGSVAMF